MTKANVKSSNHIVDSNLRKIYDASPIAMILSRPDGSFEYVNPAFLNLLGYDSEEIYQKQIIISHPEDISLNHNIREQLQSDPFTPVVIEKRYVHKSGKTIPGLLTLVAQADNDGKIERFIAQIVDLTERKKTEDALLLFRSLVHESNDCMFVIDPKTSNIIDANKQAYTSLGYSYEELLEIRVVDVEAVLIDSEMWKQHVIEMQSIRSKILESKHKRKDGSVYDVEVSISYISEGNNDYIIAMARDVTERKKADALIWKQANYDALTGLPNRRMLQDRLTEAIKKANRTHQHFAVLCLDLDNFKDINDTLGHLQGDQLLLTAAQRIQECARETDTVARMGGDEFMIILDELDNDFSVERVSSALLDTLRKPFSLTPNTVHISASIGVILFPNDATDAETLLKLSDQAMYSAKSKGKDQYQYFSSALQHETEQRIWLSQELHEAITNGQFRLVYQPVVCLKTQQFHRAEALLRWQHPTAGAISPGQFIPVAEHNGSIIKIGEWVFHEVVKQVKTWRETFDPQFQISINTSPIQFRHYEASMQKWTTYLKKSDVPGQALIVELTEGTLLDFKAGVDNTLQQYRKVGMEVAIDDFGTGYSSLSYLKKLDIDYLKIDQSFVHNLSTDLDDAALCEAIIVMAHKLNLKVIAEGIETKQQADILAAAGCDYGQGFYFSQGVTSEVLEKQWLAKAK